MTLATELLLTMGRLDRYPVMEVNVPDGLYREVVLARLSALFDRPVIRGVACVPVVEIADERYRADIDTICRMAWSVLVAGSLYPTAQECGPDRPFPDRAYKGSGNRAREALWRGAFAREDIIVRRVCVDIEERIRRENSGAE